MSTSSVTYKQLPTLDEIDPGIEPVDVSVLVLPMELEEKTKGGILLASASRERDDAAAMEGRLVAASPAAWVDTTPQLPAPALGDVVLFARYAGVGVLGRDGRMYRLIQDRDVKCVLQFDRSREGPAVARVGLADRQQFVREAAQ